MKLKITVLFFALFAVLCDAEISRVIDEQWNILDTPRYAMRIYWMRGEAVTFNLKVTAGDRVTPYQELTNDNVHVVWSITGTDAPTNIYVATTGTVVNATNGMVQYTLTPEEGNLTDGEYDGYATAFTKDGSEITQLAVLARQAVTVKWSPQGLEYSSVAFATPPFYTTNQIDGMTNSLWLQALSNEAGIATNAINIATNTADIAANTDLIVSNVMSGATNTANIAINAADIATNSAYFMTHTNAQYTINTNIEERLAAREALPEIPTDAVTNIILNGVTNTPVDNVVDLGTIVTSVTNVEVTLPNDITLKEIVTIVGEGLEASSAGVSACNGTYNEITSTLYTNITGGSYMEFRSSPDTWVIVNSGSDVYYLESSTTTPWLEAGWGFYSPPSSPAPTFVAATSTTSTNTVVSLADIGTRVEASIYTDTGTGSTETIAITNEYTKLNAFEDAHYYTNCTVVSSNSNVVVTNLGTYMVGFNIAGEYDGTPAETLKSAVFANDVEQHHIHGAAHHETDDITQMSAGPGFVIVTNVPCAIDVRIREVGSGTGTYTAYWGSLNVVRMHE